MASSQNKKALLKEARERYDRLERVLDEVRCLDGHAVTITPREVSL